MKKYYSNNEELNEILVNNGIDLTCNEDMEVLVSNLDAERIKAIVKEQAPAAIDDYTLEDFEPDTYEEKLVEAAKEAQTRKELIEKVDAIVAEIINEDPRLYGIGRKIAGYGTWHMTLWLNEYRFGEGLKAKLEQHYLVTHDEDKEFTLADFEEIINDTCQEYAYDQF